MIRSLFLSFPSSWNHRRHSQQPSIKCVSTTALSKKGRSFLSSLATSSGDSATASRLIKKFVASSPKFVALDTLSYLLSPKDSLPQLSSLALPLYIKISEATWYNWNYKLVAELTALLHKLGEYTESETLISETVLKLKFRERDLAQFYGFLVESHSKHNSTQGFDDSLARLHELVRHSSSFHVKKLGFKSMVNSLSQIGQLAEAESVMEEMRTEGIKPALYEFGCMVYGYGRLGLLEDMERIVFQMENEGLSDTVCSNMVLASYGAHNALSKMAPWLQKMKNLDIPFSIRTYNSVLNSCPTIMSMLQDLNSIPLSLVELVENLKGEEALLVKELAGSSILDNVMAWDVSEAKLDLHGMHLSSAYLIMLLWIEAMQFRLNDEVVVPAQMKIVSGSGKHSRDSGESPVKNLVKEIMFRMKSPMRIDRKNIGCFVAKTKAVKSWLSLLLEQQSTELDKIIQ